MNQIQVIRTARGITQEQLAVKIDVDRSTIAKWETGKALPRAELLPKLARALNCSIDNLLSVCEEGDDINARTKPSV